LGDAAGTHFLSGTPQIFLGDALENAAGDALIGGSLLTSLDRLMA
jgi:hypothetical protein